MARVLDGEGGSAVRLAAMPHPSAQGLLSMAPHRGRGARMADLQALWRHRCAEALLAAGLPAPESPSPQERPA
jgi:hypothetical protein